MQSASAGRVGLDSTLLAPRLRLMRTQSGISQQAVADAIGKSQGAVAALEAGRIHSIEVDTLRRLAAVLGVDGHVLFSPLLGDPGRPRRKGTYSAVSLFSGCGGMDLGAEQTGRVKTVWANDNEHWAVETYRRNLGAHIVEGDVRKLDVPDVACDILLAGPPCQDYSTLWNHDGAKTARGNLFREVSRFLATLEPAAFVMENVPGLLSANNGAAWTIVRHALRSPARFTGSGRQTLRYDLSAQVVDMADLGVPQHRERLIVVGIRRDLGARPPQLRGAYRGRPVTVADALDCFPIDPSAANNEVGLDTEEVVERLKLIPPGSNYEVIPPGHPLAVRGLISHVYRRLHPDEPSYTIIAGGGGGTHGYHHREPRRLSNRERARLQSFPDEFVFEHGCTPGQRGARSMYPRVRRQIGNAVPPLAARAIVQGVVEALDAAGVLAHSSAEIHEVRRQVMHLGRPLPSHRRVDPDTGTPGKGVANR